MELPQTIHIVDDDEAVGRSIKFLLESNGWIAAFYQGAEAFLAAALPRAGCVITDFHMPGMNGLQLQAELAEQAIRLPVILMTGHGEVPVAVRAMKAGAVDFLEKPFADDTLFLAVEQALARNRRALEAAAATETARQRIALLTPREREVLDLLVLGQSNKEMARHLGTSPRTIDVHRAHVLHKLQIDKLPDLVRLVETSRRTEPPA